MFYHETFLIFTKSQEQEEEEQQQQLCYFMDRALRSRGQKVIFLWYTKLLTWAPPYASYH